MPSVQRLVCIPGLMVLAAVAGCGSSTATVSGKVTLADGSPLPGGQITFQSASKPDAKASVEFGADGVYTVENVPVGECVVTVNNTYLKNVSPAPQIKPGSVPMMGTGGDVGIIKYVAIDPKYTSPSTSGLSATVRWNTSGVDFRVTPVK